MERPETPGKTRTESIGESAMPGSFVLYLLISPVAYGLFPLVLAGLQGRRISRRRYRAFCFGVNLLVLALMAALTRQAAVSLAYLLWTLVFSGVGIRLLQSRGLVDEF